MSSSSIVIELWTEFGLASLLTIGRITIRLHTVGIRKFRADDYLSIILLIVYAALCSLAEVIIELSGDLEPVDTTSQLQKIIRLNKFLFTSSMIYVLFIWMAKATLLFYYTSLTNPLWQRRQLSQIAIFICVITFIPVVVVMLGFCKRFEDHWVPTISEHNCRTANAIPYTIVICNVVSDLCLLLFPIPVVVTLFRTTLTFTRKFIICLMLCSGIFTITTAIIVLIKYTTTLDRISPSIWVRREMFVWIIIVNTPSLLSAFKKKILDQSPPQSVSSLRIPENKNTERRLSYA